MEIILICAACYLLFIELPAAIIHDRKKNNHE